jgi:hypothetical protein
MGVRIEGLRYETIDKRLVLAMIRKMAVIFPPPPVRKPAPRRSAF